MLPDAITSLRWRCPYTNFYQFRDAAAVGGWNLFCTAFAGLDCLTPASHLTLRTNGKGAFFGWPDDPKIEALREAWFNTQDLAEQSNRRVGITDASD